MDASNIDYNLINQACHMAKKHGINVSRKQAYQLLLKGGVIYPDGRPTKKALQNGLVGKEYVKIDKISDENNGKNQFRIPVGISKDEFYRHLLASIPDEYIDITKEDKTLRSNPRLQKEALTSLKETMKMFLTVPFSKFSTRDLGATVFYSYKLLLSLAPYMIQRDSDFLHDEFNHICAIYTKRVGNSDKALAQISKCMKEAKADVKN